MLTHLALALTPVLAVQTDAASLHPADAGLYVELPDLPAFLAAWEGGALPGLLADDALVDLYELFGLEGYDDLWAMLPAEVHRDVMPIVRGVEGVSISAKLDLANLEENIAEAAVAFQILGDLDELWWETWWLDSSEGQEPPSIEELGLDPALLIDPFGHPYQLSWDQGLPTWTCLGADGQPGGTGMDADWTDEGSFEEYVTAKVLEHVGLELAVTWTTAEVAGDMATMLAFLDARFQSELPLAEVVDLNGDAPGLATMYRIDPAMLDLGSGPQLEVSLQHHGRTSLMTLGTIPARDVHALAAAAAGGTPHEASLAGAGRLAPLMAKVSSDEGAAVWQGAVLGFDGLPTEGAMADALGNVSSLLAFFGFHGEGSAWQTRLVDGVYAGKAVRPVGGQPRVDLTDAIAMVPADAVMAQVGTLDPGVLWREARAMAQGEEELLALFAEGGIDLEADLMDNLGRTYAMWMEPVKSLAPPQMHVVMPVRDGAKLMAALDAITDMVAEQGPDVGVSHRPYRGSSYTVLDLGIPIGFSPSYAVIDGHLWLSNSSTLIKRRIRAVAKGEVADGGPHPALAGLDPEDLQAAMHFDLGALLSAYYATGRAFAGMVPAGVGLPQGWASALPEPDIFARHLRPETRVTRFVGDELVTLSQSSLGPELALAGMGVGAAMPMMMIGRVDGLDEDPAWEAEGGWLEGDLAGGAGGIFFEDDDPLAMTFEEAVTDANLATVDLALLIYNLENDDYPASLADLTTATSSYPQGYLGGSEVPKDGWDNELVYERVSKTGYRLRSAGANGVDEDGEGDDWVVQ